MGMSTTERVQLVAVTATALVARGGYYLAETYTATGRGGTGWGTVVIILPTIAGVVLCSAAVALLSLIRYADCESKAPLDHLGAGLAGLAPVSIRSLIGNRSFQGFLLIRAESFQGLPLPLGALAASLASRRIGRRAEGDSPCRSVPAAPPAERRASFK